MRKRSIRTCTITTAQQGQIIQRVLVDGWSPAEAAAAFGVEARIVKTWVADYRRHGMASLHRAPSRSFLAEIFRCRLARPLAAGWRRMTGGLRRLFIPEPPAPLAPLRRSQDDRS